MRGWIESNIERGLEIPLPDVMKKYSGKFLVRVPTYLHRNLAEQAKKEGVSLNQLVVSLLSEKITVAKLLRKIEKIEGEIKRLQNAITVSRKASKKTEKAAPIKINWEELNERKIYKLQ